MQRALSTYLFRHSALGVNCLDQMARAGIECVELDCARQHFDYTNPTHVREIAGWFSGSAVKAHAVHAPLSREPQETSHHGEVSIAFLDRQRRQDSMDEIKRVLELAEKIPFRYLILHLGLPDEEYDLRKFDAALTSLEHLRLSAGQQGVEILLENIPNELSTPQRLLEFFQHTHLHDLRVCFDSGHARLDGDVQEALALLKGRIASTHLHDNDGMKDEHRFPFDGAIRWEDLIRNLGSGLSEVPLLLEARGGEDMGASLQRALEVFERFERILSEPRE